MIFYNNKHVNLATLYAQHGTNLVTYYIYHIYKDIVLSFKIHICFDLHIFEEKLVQIIRNTSFFFIFLKLHPIAILSSLYILYLFAISKGPVTRVPHGQRMRNEWRLTLKNEWRWWRRKITRTNNAHYLMMSIYSEDQTCMKRILTDAKKWHSLPIHRLYMRHSCDQALIFSPLSTSFVSHALAYVKRPCYTSAAWSTHEKRMAFND